MDNIVRKLNISDSLLHDEYDLSNIKQMWHMVVKDKTVDVENTGCVDDFVFNSWVRSVKYNVPVTHFSEDRFLNKQKYMNHLSDYKVYLDFIKPFLIEFYESMGPSLYMLNLYSKEGYHILRIGKDTALSYSDNIGIVEGLCFKEDVNGTCGFSLADILKRTVQICGPEHYKEMLHEITGCYSPIFNEKGEYIGVISITNAKIKPNSQSVATNFALGSAISSLFRNNDILKSYKKVADNLRKYLNNLPDSLVVVNNKGIILDVNQQFIDLVEAENKNDIIGKNITEFLVEELIEMVDAVVHISGIKGKNVEVIMSTSVYYIESERGYLVLIKKSEQIKNIYKFFNQDKILNMIGGDSRYIKCLEVAYNCSKHNIPVLIEGESGTGKENMAKYIHNNSEMKHGPFIPVNCSAIPKELFESIFFGYTEGAFTNARKGGSKGKFELANGGTLFLDEIGDMPIDLQAKLLRVVEDKYIEKIGMSGKIEVDFRLIVATNKVLKNEVENNNFRKDLYYRINTILISLPPLRERKDDIELLIKHYKDIYQVKYKKNVITISNNLYAFLKEYNWPGNIRELRNMLEYMIINNTQGDVNLDVCDIPAYIKQYNKDISGICDKEDVRLQVGIIDLKAAEIEIIKKALMNNSNKSHVARELGISRDKLYRKIREISRGSG